MSQEPITSLKGIGEKTGQLFEQLGIHTVEDLLEYYPRDLRCLRITSPHRELQPDTMAAVEGMLKKDGDVRRFSRIQVTLASLSDRQDHSSLPGTICRFWLPAVKSRKPLYIPRTGSKKERKAY